MFCIVPFQAVPQRKFSAKVPIDGGNTLLKFRMTFNDLAKYWIVDIYKNEKCVYAGLPLVPGQNILEQVGYLGIGSAWIVPRSRVMEQWPSETTLESDWYIIWGDSDGGDE